MLAVRARLLLELADAKLGGADLELALLPLVEELRRAKDRVDDRPDEREQRRRGRARDQHGIVDPPPGVEEGPRDERKPNDDQKQDEEVDDEVESVVGDAEEAESHDENR